MLDLLSDAVERGESLGVTFLEIRFQESYKKVLVIRKGEYRFEPFFSRGFSVRALANGGLCFSPSSDIGQIDSIIQKCVETAKLIGTNRKKPVIFKETPGYTKKEIIKARKPHNSLDNQDKLDFLVNLDKNVRSDTVVKNFEANLEELFEKRYYVNSEGSQLFFETPAINYTLTVIGQESGQTQTRNKRVGNLGGYENVDFTHLTELTQKAVVDVKKLLQAENPPQGTFSGVLNPKLSYTLCHEAFGHMSEADSVISGGNILEGKIGEKIASEACTFIDDPGLRDGFGYYPFDDEGVPAGPTIILENGVLKNYLHNRETASKLGFELTGNARAKDYNYPPLCRMSNTYFKPGDFSQEELIAETGNGLLAVDPKGGQVGQGAFHLGVQMFYEIKNGELGKLFRGGAISGSTLETLKEVTSVGKDFEFNSGGCGKGTAGSPMQLLRMGDLGPSVACKKLIIGG
ncbi:MAG: TldD/PmbA family protein [Candidatus Odinarchaeota archaeon]